MSHNGDLGHNASVVYVDDPYLCEDGTTFTLESVSISDNTKHVVLIPSEALSLLAWLEQEREKLEQLARSNS